MSEAPHHASNALLRQCVATLDCLYSCISNRNHITLLNTIEEKLIQVQFKDFESFRAELSRMNDLPLSTLESSNNAGMAIFNKEIYHLPMFSSITYKAGSTMYSVHEASPHPVNNWLLTHVSSPSNIATSRTTATASNSTNALPRLYRLFVSEHADRMVNARDKMHATLAIFTDAIISPVKTNAHTVNMNANVTLVHSLGPLHTANIPGYKYWIKASIIKTSRAMSMIPADIAKTLFKGHEGSVQILYDASTEASDDSQKAAYEFAFSIMNATRSSTSSSLFNIPDRVVLPPNSQQKSTAAALIHVSNHAESFELINNEDALQDERSTDTQLKYANPSNIVQLYSDCTHDDKLEQHWKLLEQYAAQNDCSVVHKKDNEQALDKPADMESDSKHVYLKGSNAIHIFHTSSTPQQRILEIVCLLKTNREHQHIGRIYQLIKDDNSGSMIGFTMPKYDMTLEGYLQQHQQLELSGFQRMDVILQMVKSVKALHEQGVAHRDLSLASFKVTFTSETLLDGLPRVHLYLAHFSSAVLFAPQDTKTWWTDILAPTVDDVLAVWCKNLPYIMARPDHTQLLSRSIQTLPKTSTDHAILPYLVHASAEDVYSLGTLIWHVFSGMQAWPGLAHTDLKKLRETVHSDAHISRVIDVKTHGPASSTLLKKILCVAPEDRLSAAQVLEYIENTRMRDVLLLEWNSSTLYTETISQQPMLDDETIKRAAKRGGASGDMDLQLYSTGTEEAAVSFEPKKPKKYYIPTGRPVGRPRKKVRPKPPGRPKGRKNKVYYYAIEEEEKARLEAERANHAVSKTEERMALIHTASETVNTTTFTNAPMGILPNLTADILTEAAIQEIPSKVVNAE